MFKRRNRLHWIRKIREMLWPSMGWRRSFVYVGHRLVRLRDSNYRICCGLAVGTAVSFTPLPGLHIIQALLFGWLLRANLAAAVIGTLVGNPWTLPLMWWSSYEIGGWAFRCLGLHVRGMPDQFTWHNLFSEIREDPFGLLLPWIFGGYVMAVIGGFFSYWVFYWLVIQARSRRVRWKVRGLHHDAELMTEPRR